MMRPGPDVKKHQRPKVNDGKPIRKYRTPRRFRQEVIHQAEIWRRQKKRDGIVTIPPLHERILHAGIHRITFQRAPRHFHRVREVQHRDGDDGGDVKPDRDIHVFLAPFDDGAKKIHRERHPYNRDGNINRPFEFRVFFARRVAERQRHGRGDDDGLPAPEIEPAQKIIKHARLAQPLQRVVDAHEHAVADERKNHGVRVQRADAPEADELKIQVGVGVKQLHGGQQAHEHPDDAPHHGGDGKRADDTVVVFEGFDLCVHWSCEFMKLNSGLNAAFSLTPALSCCEREKCSRRSGKTRAGLCLAAFEFYGNFQRLFPLPWGEG